MLSAIYELNFLPSSCLHDQLEPNMNFALENLRPQATFPIVLIPIEMTQFDNSANKGKCDHTSRYFSSRNSVNVAVLIVLNKLKK